MKESQLHATIYAVIAHPEICTPAEYLFPKILDISIPGHTYVKYFPVNVYPAGKSKKCTCAMCKILYVLVFGETKHLFVLCFRRNYLGRWILSKIYPRSIQNLHIRYKVRSSPEGPTEII